MGIPDADPFETIDELLCSAASEALPLGHLDPANSKEEKVKLERDPAYNPQFTYAPQDRDKLSRIRDHLLALEIPEQGVGHFLREARDYLATRLFLRLQLGLSDAWREPVYPLPPERITALARRMISAPRPLGRTVDRPFGAEDQARLIRQRLRQYNLTDWQVLIKPNISSTNTDAANRLVIIRAEGTYTMAEMKRMVVHEVDTHVLRAANGYAQPYRIFAVGAVPSYLATEEGLAVINEERMGYIDNPRNRTFAARVVASVRAHTSAFGDVYRELRDHSMTHDEAWNITRRVKRGLGDTSQPGGFMKDHVYLWGRVLVEEYVLTGGDLSRLYVGKVALEHVPRVGELGLRPPRYIPAPFT